MRNLNRDTLIKLGFKETQVTAEESGCKNGYTYFTYDTKDEYTVLISSADDDLSDGLFYVEFFELQSLGKIYSSELLSELILMFSKMDRS